MKLAVQLPKKNKFLVFENIPHITLANFREFFIIRDNPQSELFYITDALGIDKVGVCFQCGRLFYKGSNSKFCCYDCFTKWRNIHGYPFRRHKGITAERERR